MNSICILETKKTPFINLNPKEGKLEISGYRSMPEISSNFYTPVIDWVREYVKCPGCKKTVISFRLEYFNTTSGKCFVEILKWLDKLAGKGHPVSMKWYYEEDDEDMDTSGDDLSAMIKYISIEKIPFNSQ